MDDVSGSAVPGTRTIRDLYLAETTCIEKSSDGEVLEPGDLILFRGEGNWLSEMISSLDGYWTHSSIYVGDGRLVHAYTLGVVETDVQAMIDDYPAGVGIARPCLSEAERSKAALWARDVASGGSSAAGYSGWDLGVAYALLCRARGRGGLEMLGAPVGDDESWVEGIGGETDATFTCSGLVYAAYEDGAGAPLEIEVAPGLDLDDNCNVHVAPPSMLESVASGPGVESQSGLEGSAVPSVAGIDSERITYWRHRIGMFAGALGGLLYTRLSGRSVPLGDVVTPADLWCSPSMEGRWFFADEHRERARQALGEYCGPSA